MTLRKHLTLTALAVSLAISLPVLETTAPLPWQSSFFSTPPAALAQNLAIAANVRVQDVPVIGMTVSDMDEAIAFYSDVLTFEKISDVEVLGAEMEALQGVFGVRMRVVQMQLGDEVIELTQYLAPMGGRPVPIDSKSNDLWFQHVAIVVSDMDAAYERLREFNVQHVSTGPQTLPESIPAAAGIKAFYFQDPDGHNLEVIFFPEDKGDRRWQDHDGEIFLGIDHTAIAVANTEESLKFYRDLLGFAVAGESFNSGTEQAHLNNVEGARLHISGLSVGQGMAVEFLQYLEPGPGRSYPADSQANDLWHWEISMVVPDAEALAARLLEADVTFVSDGVISLPTDDLGFRQGFLIRDPDGHVIRVIEP